MSQKLATTVEWQVLDAIQPFFASALPWELSEPDRWNNDAGAALELEIENTKWIFRVEIGLLVQNLPQHALSPQSFKLCVRDLAELLQFLESLVLDQICAFSEGLHAHQDEAEKNYFLSPSKLTDQFLQWYNYLTAGPLSPGGSQKPYDKIATSIETVPEVRAKQQDPPRYKKLEVLRKIVEAAGSQSCTYCSNFLSFKQTLKNFQNGTSRAARLNKRLEGLTQVPGNTFKTSAASTIAKTRWESNKPWIMFDRLFRMLTDSTCHQHIARLRLNGFRFDECSSGSPPIDMFMSSCPSQTYWQDCRYQPISNTDDRSKFMALARRDGRVALSDLCEYIRASKAARSDRLLSVEFDDQMLLYWPDGRDTSVHSGNSHMVSFNDLLDQELLQEPGGMFDANDKAVLALSLARCLLHLVQSPWLQDIWTEENIQFLARDDEVCDVWHPYISCPVSEDAGSSHANPMLMVLSFARLLVELEIGVRLHLDPSSQTFEDDIATIQEEEMDNGGREDYNQAVEGCFRVQARLLRASAVNSGTGKDPRYLLRKAIYHDVVSCLERNFSQIPRKTRREILPVINNGKRATKSGIPTTSKVDNRLSSIHLPEPRGSTYALLSETKSKSNGVISGFGSAREVKSTEPTVESSSSDASSSDTAELQSVLTTRGIRSNGAVKKCNFKTMFFDGVTASQKQSHACLAETFFASFNEFRERYIIPKVKGGRSDWRRVRIAILDTGINTDAISGYLDDISDARRKQKCKAKDRNPIKAAKNFTGDKRDTCQDTCGHGTQVASILLRLAPECDLYIAKISSGIDFDNAAGVAKAIDWAIDDCNVDIINMSFGSIYRDTQIERAIGRARERKPYETILFAAASNAGLHQPRTYPASDSRVIGVHALDGHGNDSGGLNPSAHDQHDRFGTLGLGIKIVWNDEVVYKSGSSFATPTAAAIAANVMDWLYYVRKQDLISDSHYNFLKRTDGIRHVFNLQSVPSGSLLSVAPETLFKLHLEEHEADTVICGRLQHGLPPVR